MRLLWPSLLVFMLMNAPVTAGSPTQNDDPDDRIVSLTQQIEAAGDREKPRLLNQLAQLLRRQEPERAIELARQAIELATGQDDLRATADGHKVVGLGQLTMDLYADSLAEMQEAEALYRRLGEDQETAKCLGYQGMAMASMGRLWPAIEVVERARDMFRELGDEKGIAASTNNLGVYFEEVGEHEQALRCNLDALELERSLGRTRGVANNLNSIGNIHSKLENHEQARGYYQQALELFEQIDDRYGVVQCLNNIGNTHENLDQDEQALQYFGRALEAARALGIPALEANPLTNQGIVYKKRKEYEKALDSYQQAAKIEQRLGEMANLAITYQNIGETYLLMKQPSDALEYLHRSEAIASETGSNAALEGTYRNLAEAHRQQGDFRDAYESLLRYGEVRDAHLSEEKNRVVAELQARYDADRRREEIELLKKDNQIQGLELGRTKLTAALLVAVTVLVIGAAVLLLRRYRSLLAFWKKKVFIGPYRVGEEISTGGMGVVYRATNVLDPGKTIALKVIREESAGDATQRKRFVNEGRIIDAIKHPNIVTVFDRGEHNQKLYIAMEYLAGPTLAQILSENARRGTVITLPRCLSIMGQLADAVTSIHAMGITHRDIKPDNVIVTRSEDAKELVKLLDFGAAKLDTMTTLTGAGELVGTVSYLAPERVRHQAPTTASDVFSLGIVFYELLTLEKPFPADNPAVLLRQLLEAEPVAPATFRPGIGSTLSALVMAMLRKDPSRRPDGDELVHRLARLSAAEA
jgi:tetratricopeptide (TPR) repeat protein